MTNRFLIPFFSEVELYAMDDEKSVDDDKKVVGIPEGIETGNLFEGLG